MKTEQAERETALRILGEMVTQIRVAMLTTLDPEGSLRSRPMETIPTSFDGDLWFFTKFHTSKVDEVTRNAHVSLCYAAPAQQRYVWIQGQATVVRDDKRAELFWSPHYLAWFPEGLDDPDLALLKVSVEQAEYWDAPTSTMVQLGGFLQSMVGAGRSRSKEHDKISWPRPTPKSIGEHDE